MSLTQNCKLFSCGHDIDFSSFFVVLEGNCEFFAVCSGVSGDETLLHKAVGDGLCLEFGNDLVSSEAFRKMEHFDCVFKNYDYPVAKNVQVLNLHICTELD